MQVQFENNHKRINLIGMMHSSKRLNNNTLIVFWHLCLSLTFHNSWLIFDNSFFPFVALKIKT